MPSRTRYLVRRLDPSSFSDSSFTIEHDRYSPSSSQSRFANTILLLVLYISFFSSDMNAGDFRFNYCLLAALEKASNLTEALAVLFERSYFMLDSPDFEGDDFTFSLLALSLVKNY